MAFPSENTSGFLPSTTDSMPLFSESGQSKQVLNAEEIVFGHQNSSEGLNLALREGELQGGLAKPKDPPEKVPKFGELDYTVESVTKRRAWLEEKTQTKLGHISGIPVPTEKWKGNIENLIGTVQVPIGIAGPLRVNGEHANGDFYVPMATTEGAILTTYTIGMRLVTNSGGANVAVEDNLSHISPMFYVEDLRDGKNFIKWLNEHFEKIKQTAESTTKHGKLISIKPAYYDRMVVVQFNFFTGDAQGMNMINVATEQACFMISEETGRLFHVRSNYSAVKKMSVHNMMPTFGKSVRAEAKILKSELRKLKVSAKDIAETWHTGLSINQKSSILGPNCQAANCISAVFLACGQDIADISSSHVAYSNFVAVQEDLYAEVYIPSLVIGTVGGGTGKGAQKECLEIMGCSGSNKVLKFAEIIGAAALAGEVTTICAITTGTFVKAHASLGRNRPD